MAQREWRIGAVSSDPSDFLNPPDSNRTPNDPFNEFVGTSGLLTTADILATEALGFTSTLAVVNPPPPAATTAVMVLRQTSVPPSITDGTYQIYDIGNNAILADYQLGKVGAPWQFVTLGGFNDGDTSDMLLRNATTGAFQVYDIVNNNITNSASLGAVGLNFKVLGFGNFGSFGNTDMMLRDDNTGALQVYNISNNQITNSASMGVVGLDWQFSGVGNFSSPRHQRYARCATQIPADCRFTTSTAIRSPAPSSSATSAWIASSRASATSAACPAKAISCCATAAPAHCKSTTSPTISSPAPSSLGAVGTDYQFAGVAPISAAGRSDLVLRNVNTGAFQAYNIAFNSLIGSASLGALGLDWQLGGFGGRSSDRLHGQHRRSTICDSSSQPTAMRWLNRPDGDEHLPTRRRRWKCGRLPG